MSKHSFYFDHDYNARNDQKILELRAEYGWEGYGIYFAIIEILCESDNCIKRGALGGLSLGLSMDKALVEKILNFMISIGLLCENNNIIYSKRIAEHLAFRTMLSEAGKKGGRGNKKPPFSEAKAPLEAGKERIEEDSKEKDNKKENNNIESEKEIFEEFRKLYKGTKRGLDIEFDNFRKKHSDWKEVNKILKDCLIKQIKARDINTQNKKFVPQWKNLQTYINNRAWEEEIAILESNNFQSQQSQSRMAFEQNIPPI